MLGCCSTLDALARLRIRKQRVVPVEIVLDLKVVPIRGGPVALECLSNLVLVHAALSFVPIVVTP